MKQNERPPEKKHDEELSERFEGSPVLDGAEKKQKEIEKYEKAAEVITSPSKQQEDELKKQIELAFEQGDAQKIAELKTEKKYFIHNKGIGGPSESSFLKKAKTWLLGLTALGLSTTASGQTKQTEKDPQTKGKIEVYTKANTKEGGITPTGYDNSFLNNPYGVTVEEFENYLDEHELDKTNPQKSLLDFVQKEKPELLDSVLNEYGQTEKGRSENLSKYDKKGLYDNMIGIRTAYLVYLLRETLPENKTTTPEQYSEFSQRGESIFGPDGKIVGELCYPTRKTDTVTEAGNLNTSEVEAIIRWRDDFGFIGAVQEIKKDGTQKLFGTTNHFQDPTSPELLVGLKLIKEKREGNDLLTKNK